MWFLEMIIFKIYSDHIEAAGTSLELQRMQAQARTCACWTSADFHAIVQTW